MAGSGSDCVSKEEGDLSSKVSVLSVPPNPRTEGEILQSPNLKSFNFSELKSATRNFRPDSVVGEGGFGSVFKGWIDEQTLTAAKPGTGTVIAVKRLNQEGPQGHGEWLVSITFNLLTIRTFSKHGNLRCFCILTLRNKPSKKVIKFSFFYYYLRFLIFIAVRYIYIYIYLSSSEALN